MKVFVLGMRAIKSESVLEMPDFFLFLFFLTMILIAAPCGEGRVDNFVVCGAGLLVFTAVVLGSCSRQAVGVVFVL